MAQMSFHHRVARLGCGFLTVLHNGIQQGLCIVPVLLPGEELRREGVISMTIGAALWDSLCSRKNLHAAMTHCRLLRYSVQ